MTVVTRNAGSREIADALNKFASKIGTGSVTLTDETDTDLVDARISPTSVVILVPDSAGGDASNIHPICSQGLAALDHGTGRGGQVYRYVIVNL